MSRILLLFIAVFLLGESVSAQKKRGQTSMKFLSVSPSARASAMSDAVTSVSMSAYSAFYNPATMAHYAGTYSLSAGAVQWITDINHNSASFIYRPFDGKIGVFGLNAISVDYGDIISTAYDPDDPSGFRDLGFINPTAFALGLSYANAVTDQFSVGANFRYSKQNLGNVAVDRVDDTYLTESFSATASVLDFGVLYKTGFESLNFGMALRNFSPEVTYDEEKSELPLTFKIGISMDILDLTEIDKNHHSLLVSIDANRPRDFDEQLFLGFEYSFLKRFMLRGGYGFPKDEEEFSVGAGIKQPFGNANISFDYSYTQFGFFGEVNRISVQLGL
ncbi:MAG: PorV/PorQ family protein [Balneola sp.]